MGITFIVLPAEGEVRAGLLALVGELKFFFPDQLKVLDAIALESGSILMNHFCEQIAESVGEREAALHILPADEWQPEAAPEAETIMAQVFDKVIEESVDVDPVVESIQETTEVEQPVEEATPERVCGECGKPIIGKAKNFCSKPCYMKDYFRRKGKGNGKDADFVQTRKWRIMSSGKEVEDITHLLERGKLVLGEVVRNIDGKRYHVVEKDTGVLALEHLWSFK